MVDAPVADIRTGYSELAERLRTAGLMEHRRGAFAAKSVAVLTVATGCWMAMLVIGDHWANLGVAAALGLIWPQVIFFGHDAGHHQIFRRPWGNRLVGLVAGNLLTGLSFGWWEPKHRAHHAHPNQVGKDPDIAPGAIAFTTDAAAERGPLGRLALRSQAWTFFPLLALEGIGLRISSVRSVWQRRHDPRARVEALLIVVHLAIYLSAVAWVLSPLKAVVFVTVQQAAFGLYLGSSFAPNHKGMPTVAADSKVHFAEQQIVTARNVHAGRILTFLLGGLNYQIEHHLFPRMPMGNLRRSQPLVRAFCHAHGLPYRQDTLLRSYLATLGHLHRIGNGGGDPSPLPRLTPPAIA